MKKFTVTYKDKSSKEIYGNRLDIENECFRIRYIEGEAFDSKTIEETFIPVKVVKSLNVRIAGDG